MQGMSLILEQERTWKAVKISMFLRTLGYRQYQGFGSLLKEEMRLRLKIG
ncbi:hypothetical protein LINPERHAP1_LOCUS29520 [Linum perenne]